MSVRDRNKLDEWIDGIRDDCWVWRRGAPGGGPGEISMVPGLHMFKQAFRYSYYGYASSIGVVLFAIMMTLTYLNSRYIRSGIEYEA